MSYIKKNLKVEKMLKMDDSLFKTSAQVAKLLKPYEDMNKYIHNIQKNLQPMYAQIELTKKITPDYWTNLQSVLETSIKARQSLNYLNNDAMIAALNNVAKSLETLDMGKTLKQISKFETETSDFDWNKIKLKENAVISYDEIEYKAEEIASEIEEQTKILEDISCSKEKYLEAWKKLLEYLNMLVIIITLCTAGPQFIELLGEGYAHIQSQITGEYRVGFTEYEKNYLRSEAYGTADVIMVLPYDSRVDILNDIPRWYQVKYYDEDKGEVIGWIAKKNIKKEIW